MKHIFIINPAAGKANAYNEIESALHPLSKEVDYEIYQTNSGRARCESDNSRG